MLINLTRFFGSSTGPIQHGYVPLSSEWLALDGVEITDPPDQLEGRIADRLMDLALCEQVYTVDKSFRQHQARAKQRKSAKKGA